MSLLSLPNEILNQICSALITNCSYTKRIQYLYSLCLASEQLCAVAQPHLFSYTSTTEAQIASLLESLELRQDLADAVVELKVICCSKRAPDSIAVNAKAESSTRTVSKHERPKVEVMTGILSKLRNVKGITMGVDCIYDDILRHPERDLAIRPLGKLESLQIVYTGHEDILYLSRLNFILKSCSNIREFGIRAPAACISGEGMRVLTKIESVSLKCPGVLEHGFKDLVMACLKMRSFQFWGGEPQTWMPESPISTRGMVQTLTCCKESLCALGIESDESSVDDLGEAFQFNAGLVDDFQQFKILEELTIESDKLCSTSTFLYKLPRSLKCLQILYTKDQVFEELKTLARIATDEFPSLKMVVIGGFETSKLNDQLSDVFRESKVLLTIL